MSTKEDPRDLYVEDLQRRLLDCKRQLHAAYSLLGLIVDPEPPEGWHKVAIPSRGTKLEIYAKPGVPNIPHFGLVSRLHREGVITTHPLTGQGWGSILLPTPAEVARYLGLRSER